VPQNGAYCQRIVKILNTSAVAHSVIDIAEDRPATGAMVEGALKMDPAITHVAQVHCETGTGILNPLAEIAAVCARHGKGLIVDAMSSFGAIEIDVAKHPSTRSLPPPASASRALPHGLRHRAPGPCSRKARATRIPSRSTCTTSGPTCARPRSGASRRRRTWSPDSRGARPVQGEGGTRARGARYRHNCETLLEAMGALGFKTFLPRAAQAPIIVTFHAPADPAYAFKPFYEKVRARGYILYPGKLTQVETFRVGCIGAIDATEMRNVGAAVADVLKEMGIRQVAPAEPSAVATSPRATA